MSNFAQMFLILLAILTCFARNGLSRVINKQAQEETEFIIKSCSTTTYPRICYSTLSVHATEIQSSSKLLAHAALNVTLDSAKSTCIIMSKLSQFHGMTPREVGAMKDCVEELGDSIDELRRSLDEMSSSKASDFRLMINDVQTWVSAALTDETTCSDGFAGKVMNGNLKTMVRGRIVNIAQMTSNALGLISNALGLINNYASLHS